MTAYGASTRPLSQNSLWANVLGRTTLVLTSILTRLLTLGLLTTALACASAGSSSGRPEAALAQTRDAQSTYRELRRRWFSADVEARKRLEPALRDFLSRYPSDARAPSVQTYLAWVYVKKGELTTAGDLVKQARSSASPAVRDFVKVAEAAILIERGEAQRALVLLATLNRKVIDPEERLVYGEQLANAAFVARRWREALGALERWISDAPAHSQDDVQTLSRNMLRSFPTDELERELAALDLQSKTEQLSPGKIWLRMALRERLTAVALKSRDFELARRLLDSAPASFRSGESGALLVRLASSGALTPLIAGRSLGVVLGVRSVDARRRSASVAAGMARALGLPASEGDPAAVRLLVRDDGGEVDGTERALSELASEGAAILVAGVDDEGAGRALAYAETEHIPVLLLRTPPKVPVRFGFVVGANETEERDVLKAELARRGLLQVAQVGAGGASCQAVAERAGEPRFPIAVWKRERVHALTLMSDAACALDVEAELVRARLKPTLLCGLECAELAVGQGRSLEWYGIQAGRFPSASRVGTPLTFYEALGHDAASLAKVALRDFPLERVDDAKGVVELHARAERGLSAASAELWSTEERGFSGGRVLARRLTVVGRAGHLP